MLPDYLAYLVLTVLYRTANDTTEKVVLKLHAVKAWREGVVFFSDAPDFKTWRVDEELLRAYAIRTITADWAGWIIAGAKPGTDWMPELTRIFNGFSLEVHVEERRTAKLQRGLISEHARRERHDRKVMEFMFNSRAKARA